MMSGFPSVAATEPHPRPVGAMRSQLGSPSRARRLLGFFLAAMVFLSACAEAVDEPFKSDLDDDAPSEQAGGTEVEPDAGCNTDNPAASLRPTGDLPSPSELPAGSYMDEIRDRGVLRAGVGADTLLFGFLNPQTGNLEGFDIEMARLVADAIFGDPNQIELIPVQSAERIDRIEDGTVDLVVKTMTITCTRWASINFSSAYYQAGQRLLVAENSGIESIDDLPKVDGSTDDADASQAICSVAKTTSLANLEAANIQTVSADQWTECLVAFQQGEAFGVSTDDTILAGLAAQDPYAVVVGESFSAEPYGIGLPKDRPEFTTFVNAVLEQARTDGTWEQLYDLWLAPVLGTDRTVPAASYRP